MTYFANWQITDINVVNEYFVCIYFRTALGFATIRVNNIFISQFIALQCCYHNYIAIFATFSFLRAEGKWWPVWWIFGNLEEYNILGRIQGPFELEFMPVSARGFALFRQQDIGHLRKRLDLYNKCICAVKMRLKLQQVRFWNDQKSANVVMWKDKEYEYI